MRWHPRWLFVLSPVRRQSVAALCLSIVGWARHTWRDSVGKSRCSRLVIAWDMARQVVRCRAVFDVLGMFDIKVWAISSRQRNVFFMQKPRVRFTRRLRSFDHGRLMNPAHGGLPGRHRTHVGLGRR